MKTETEITLLERAAFTENGLAATGEHAMDRSISSVHHYLEAATSHNTRNAYQADIRHFLAWGGLLPSTPDVLLHYLQQHADILNPRTLKRRLVAIRQWHACQQFPDPTSHPLIRKTLSGICHLHGTPPVKALPLAPEQLAQIVSCLASRGKPADLRDSALLQTGFFGAFRRSELVALRWEDIRQVPEGMEIMIRRSKTDQEGHGAQCAIPYGNNQLCPVRAIQRWNAAVGNRDEGYIFCRISRHREPADQPLAPDSVSRILKSLAAACGFPQPERYSAHSLRHGFATSASRQGASFGAIMRHGRWRHEGTVHGYIEEGRQFEDNAATSIIDGMEKNRNTDNKI